MEKSYIRYVKNVIHKLGASVAHVYYQRPSTHLKVIGVTGTDGKTTTSHLIYHILVSAGKKASISSTVYADIGGRIHDTGLHMTTQNHWLVQKDLHEAVQAGCEFFVQETTSHALDQGRVGGVNFYVGVLTNITSEHLDYHKTFDAYVAAKMKLLLGARYPIINRDAECYDQVSGILKKANKKYTTYSLQNPDANVMWDDEIKTSLKESFNHQNIMAAYAVCLKLGLTKEEILKGIQTFTLPKGRLDKVYSGDFEVYIDFAHTPHSIRSVLSDLKGKRGRLIHVFGSAGLRDAQKRPDMGRASGEFADITVLTEEDYRTEDFMKITQVVSQGLFENGFSYAEPDNLIEKSADGKVFTTIKNRERAIEYAISLAKKGDIVVLTGKGHEQSLARGKEEIPWDEYRAVEKAINSREEHT